MLDLKFFIKQYFRFTFAWFETKHSIIFVKINISLRPVDNCFNQCLYFSFRWFRHDLNTSRKCAANENGKFSLFVICNIFTSALIYLCWSEYLTICVLSFWAYFISILISVSCSKTKNIWNYKKLPLQKMNTILPRSGICGDVQLQCFPNRSVMFFPSSEIGYDVIFLYSNEGCPCHF